MPNKHGSKWIAPQSRLAIYLRDGLACLYCGVSVEDGHVLSLDHIVPRSVGGRNHAPNLVTCCIRCNSRRRNMPLREFLRDHIVTGGEVLRAERLGALLAKVRRHTRRKPQLREAKHLIHMRKTGKGARLKANGFKTAKAG